jgi:arylsulfatase A-like enzyme
MTGLSSLEAGMWRGPSQREDSDRVFKPGIKLLPQYLKDAGYATGIFGKWHLGYKSPDLPNDRGFDEFVGFLGGAHSYKAGRSGRILHNGQPITTDKHLTDLFADHAEAFIRKNADRPWFCYVPFNAVHGPLRSDDRPADSAKSEWLAKYENLEPKRRDYCAVLSHADDRLGKLLALLRELNIDQQTLVICHSDNGGMIEKFPGNNGPLRGEKGTTYEGGLRVPAVIAWPGKIPSGVVSTADAVHFDIFSTILEAAGIAPPKSNGPHSVSGVSLLAHAKSPGQSPLPDRHLFWDLYGKMAATRGDWKIVATIDNHHGKWDAALKEIEQTEFELYNLSTDLEEQNNLAAKHPDIARDLKQRYLAWFSAATLRPGGPKGNSPDR